MVNMSDLAYYIISMPEKQFAYFFGILATKNPDKIRVYAEHVFFYVLIITETEGFEPSCPKRANAFRVFYSQHTLADFEKKCPILREKALVRKKIIFSPLRLFPTVRNARELSERTNRTAIKHNNRKSP